MRAFFVLLALVVAGLPPTAQVAWSDEVPIRSFYGTYEGRTLFPMGEPRNRDLLVRIRASGPFGFTVEWHTTIYSNKADGLRKIQALEFQPSTRPNIYSATPPASQADKPEFPNPADGPPYAWARVLGKTLTVNVLTITDNADYVIQTYDRTLTNTGMTVDFTRLRNGRFERQIKGTLTRTAD